MKAVDDGRAARRIEVVAGILRDDNGRVLLAQRAPGKHLAGTWEFPGGKREAGESPEWALGRELSEELGIVIAAARPWFALTHTYPDRVVRLALFEVERWHGRPDGREGQALRWVAPSEMSGLPMPAADRPIVKAFGLDCRQAIAPEPADAGGPEGILDWARERLDSGVRLLRLRAGALGDDALTGLARHFGELVAERGGRWLLEAPACRVRTVGADGVHLDRARLHRTRGRPIEPHHLVSAACHDEHDLAHAARIDADFVTLSPVRAAPGDAHARPLCWSGFARLCRHAPVPVYALGGVRGDELATARAHGAFGIAGTGLFERTG